MIHLTFQRSIHRHFFALSSEIYDRMPAQDPFRRAMMITNTMDAWHKLVDARDATALDAILAENVVFHSPVVHTPQTGKPITALYLTAALHVLNNETFKYLREVVSGQNAVLEFQTVIDGIAINGVDMITWGDDGRITDFKVMLRPLKAVNLVHKMMGDMLQKIK